MRMPWTPKELAEKLCEADPEGAIWTSDAKCLAAARQVDKKYRPDSAGRHWRAEHWTEPPGRDLFVVVRGEAEFLKPVGSSHLQSVTVAQADRSNVAYETRSPSGYSKAAAVAAALNEFEREVPRKA
jgi:hypothetical protein